MKIHTADDGHEYVVVDDDRQMIWAGVPARLCRARWDAESPAMISGVSGRLDDVTSPGIRQRLQWLSEWSKACPERMVVLCSPPGRGKTTYAAATFRRALHTSPKPVWGSWPGLVTDVTDSWSSRDTNQSDILGRYIRSGFLVLDDFGKELTGADGLRDWQLRIAFELVNGRYERELPTLITTELSSGQMAERLDMAITSRLVHEGRWIDLSEQPDHRFAN